MLKKLSSPRMLALLASLVVAATATAHHVDAAPSECVAINDPSLLLKCYANLTREREALSTTRGEKKSPFVLIRSDWESGWQLVAAGLTGGKWRRLNLRIYSKHFWVRSDNKQDIEDVEDLRPSLWFRCMNGKMSGYIDWGIFLDVEKATIVYQYDDEPARQVLVRVSKDHKKIESLREDRLIFLIKEMFGKDKLTARVTPQGGSPLAVTFKILGLESAIKPLRNSCNW